MNQAAIRATLFAPDELTALFESTAADWALTLDQLRYLGFLLPTSDQEGIGH